MKKYVLPFILFFLLLAGTGNLYSLDILIGTAYVLDSQGNIVPDFQLLEEKFPTILLVETLSEETEGEIPSLLYFMTAYEESIDEVDIEFLEGDYSREITAIRISSPRIGSIVLTCTGEVTADEVWAEISTYSFHHRRQMYTAVGVVAMKKFQHNDEEKKNFQEIVDDIREDFQSN